jgi:hypothetical protein
VLTDTQPVTTRDFMNYLKYIELAAENLQFFLWYRDYSKRFNELPASDKALSPEWIPEHAECETPNHPKRFSPEAVAMFKGTDFDREPKVSETAKENPFFDALPHTPNSDMKRDGGESIDSYAVSMSTRAKSDHAQRATGAFESAGLKWKPRELD